MLNAKNSISKYHFQQLLYEKKSSNARKKIVKHNYSHQLAFVKRGHDLVEESLLQEKF